MSQFQPPQSPLPSRPQPEQEQPSPVQTQWQQPPSQPLPQQYVPQQPARLVLQPSRKKSRIGILIAACVIAVLIIIIAIAAGGHSGSQPTTSTSSTSTGNQQQSTQVANQPTAVANVIGKPVVVDSTWTVTVNSVKTSQGDQISTPNSGNIYVVVDVTLKNTSSTQQNVSSLIQFNFKDGTGQQYTETVTDFTHPPDGTLSAGDILRGQLTYEVPTSQHAFTLQFQSDMANADIAEWTLKI